MNINKTNYELWFIDYLDGKLDSGGEEELDAFLKTHPDLDDELKSYEEVRLEPEEVTFGDRGKLEKTEADVIGIDSSDYLLIKQMEEGLSSAEEKVLSDCFKQDESLICRGREFQKTTLLPDHTVFHDKSSLLRKNFSPIYVLFARVGVAAAVLILIFLGWEFFQPSAHYNAPVALAPLKPLGIELLPVDEISIPSSLISSSIKNTRGEGKNAIESGVAGLFDEITDVSEQNGALPEQTLFPLNAQVSKDIHFQVELPNAYEAGLRHMMPLYLDMNNKRKQLLAIEKAENKKPLDDGIFIKGLQFVDKVSGDLVNFDRMYDEDGNYVAYNLKTGGFEMERKVRR